MSENYRLTAVTHRDIFLSRVLDLGTVSHGTIGRSLGVLGLLGNLGLLLLG